jgi:hypothetical protein
MGQRGNKMSGGAFGYSQNDIRITRETIEAIIETNGNPGVDMHGDKMYSDYPELVIEKFKEAVEILKKAEEATKAIDYLVSEDTSIESFLEEWGEVIE